MTEHWTTLLLFQFLENKDRQITTSVQYDIKGDVELRQVSFHSTRLISADAVCLPAGFRLVNTFWGSGFSGSNTAEVHKLDVEVQIWSGDILKGLRIMKYFSFHYFLVEHHKVKT